jgi:hypothetical protein
MAGRNMLSLGSQVLGRSVRRYGTRLELCGASRGSADSPAIHFIVPYSAGAPSTIQYGPVRSKSTSLCRGWVETVASASPELSQKRGEQLRPWSSSVDSIATSSNRGRTRLDHHGGRPSSPVPAQVSTKLPIPNLWGLPNLYHTFPLSVCSVCVWPAWKSEGKPASPQAPQRPLCFVLWYIGSRRGQRNERHDPKAAAARDCSRLSSPLCLVLAPTRADVERLSAL